MPRIYLTSEDGDIFVLGSDGLTGAMADGWIGTAFMPESAGVFLDPIREGAEAAGRSFDDGVAELVDRHPDQADLIRAYRDRWPEMLAGAKAKLHICGDTTAILPMMIKTGADIIDVDHAVTEMARLAPLLSEHQVFSGNSDPVSVIQNGSEQSIAESVRKACRASVASNWVKR